MEKQRIFVDMDGTLAEWRQLRIIISEAEQVNGIRIQDKLHQILSAPGYYRNLKPHQNVVEAVRKLIQSDEYEIFILSAFLPNTPARKDKNAWLDEYLPEINHFHRIFVPDGHNKKEYVPNGIRPTDVLIDDYTHNLMLWSPPGQGIKLINNVNSTKKTWKGSKIHYQQDPEALYQEINTLIHETNKQNRTYNEEQRQEPE